MQTNVVFITNQAVLSYDGKKVTPLSQPYQPKTDDQRKAEFEKWAALKPVYFATWMWEVACRRSPDKYKMFLPVYQGQKVILT